MKQLLITIAVVVLVGCGESQESAPAPETKPAEPVAEAPKPEPPKANIVAVLPSAGGLDISIQQAAYDGNIEAVKQHLAAGTDVNAKDGSTPLHIAADYGHKEIVEGAEVDSNSQYDPKGVLRSGINTRTDKEINT